MIEVQTLTRRGAFARALDLYGELFARIQDGVTDDAQLATLRERFERGRTILETHRDSAADVPLSAPAAELLDSYLAGPDPEDEEAHREWLTVLPEVLVGIRRAEEMEDAARHETLDALLRDATKPLEPMYSSTLLSAMRAIALPSLIINESAWRSVNLLSEMSESMLRNVSFAMDFLVESSAYTALVTESTTRLIAESFAAYSPIAFRETNGDTVKRDLATVESTPQYAKAA